ncbi:hypothetical protein ACEUBY_21230, partial [Aeromonas caviae]|uniref:hypothetical protein n=1 Tax=Aeromonas caviae TaxID=648 RepID=UPI0038D1658A
LFSGLTALTAEFTVGEGELMTHDEPFFMAPDDKHDLISGTCSNLPKECEQGAHCNNLSRVTLGQMELA